MENIKQPGPSWRRACNSWRALARTSGTRQGQEGPGASLGPLCREHPARREAGGISTPSSPQAALSLRPRPLPERAGTRSAAAPSPGRGSKWQLHLLPESLWFSFHACSRVYSLARVAERSRPPSLPSALPFAAGRAKPVGGLEEQPLVWCSYVHALGVAPWVRARENPLAPFFSFRASLLKRARAVAQFPWPTSAAAARSKHSTCQKQFRKCNSR